MLSAWPACNEDLNLHLHLLLRGLAQLCGSGSVVGIATGYGLDGPGSVVGIENGYELDGPGSVVGIANGYGLDGPGIKC